MLWLGVTLALGLAFLSMEIHDFVTMVSHGAVAGRSAFLSGFFVLVGMHGLHVTTGAVWIAVMLVQILTIGLDEKGKDQPTPTIFLLGGPPPGIDTPGGVA